MLMSPAHYVIHIFGGVRATARAIGRSPGAIVRWKVSGQVPSLAQRAILKVAKTNKLNITPDDLAYGRRFNK